MVTNLAAQLLADGVTGQLWRVSWTGSADLYYVYVDGVLAATTSQTWYDLTVGVGQSPMVDVLDDSAATPDETFPAGITLAWYSVGGGVAQYRIDKYIDGQWVEQATVSDAWYQVWRSGTLADDTDHQYRIVPIGTNGNEGTAVEYIALVVRNPDPPAVTMAYDAGDGTVTIDEA